MSQLTLTEGHWLSIKCSPRNSDLEVFPFLTSGSNGENVSSKMILSSIQTFRNIRQDTKSELPCRLAALKTCWVSSLWVTVLVCAISLDCSRDPPQTPLMKKGKHKLLIYDKTFITSHWNKRTNSAFELWVWVQQLSNPSASTILVQSNWFDKSWPTCSTAVAALYFTSAIPLLLSICLLKLVTPRYSPKCQTSATVH